MKKFYLTIAALVVTATCADACPTLGGRIAQRTRTVTTTKQTVKLTPKTVVAEKTVLVPTKVQVAETRLVPTPVTKTVTTARTAVRAGVALPLTAFGRLREVLPCPNCR